VNPYVKIAIKVGVVFLVCIIILALYNMVGHRAFMGAKRHFQKQINTQLTTAEQLDSLLKYKPILPQIRCAQYRDIQTIRNFLPDAKEFVLTSYLRHIHALLSQNHLETSGIVITGAKATGGASFEKTFSSDISALQKDLEKIKDALQMFQDNMDKMNNLIMTFQFYQALSAGAENYAAIVGGIETHTFKMTVRGSYSDIKKFTFDIFNMRPRTALVDFQMSPLGTGIGTARLYTASFTLYTYGDANEPPPLWLAYNQQKQQPAEAQSPAEPQIESATEGTPAPPVASTSPAETPSQQPEASPRTKASVTTGGNPGGGDKPGEGNE